MNLIPKSFSRAGYRSVLKLRGSSPTILVVSGVIGLGATAVLAARASRKMDPILDTHKQIRAEIGYVGNEREQQKKLVLLYTTTAIEMTKLYGPALFVGSASAVAVLGGHKILRTRHMATVAAYSGLLEQFRNYRGRVARTWGEDVERGIYEGAHGEAIDDPDHPGQKMIVPKFDPNNQDVYLRPFFDESNVNWKRDALANYMFLKGVQTHMNNILAIRGHVFLNDVYDSLNIKRTQMGSVVGWLYNSKEGDNYIDFGFMTGIDPQTVAFQNHDERSVRLNFNIDPGMIWEKI